MPICTFICKQEIAERHDINLLVAETKKIIAKIMEVDEANVVVNIPRQLACSEEHVTLLVYAQNTEARRANIDDRALAIRTMLGRHIRGLLCVDVMLVHFGIASDGDAEHANLILNKYWIYF